jgi:hypothetical protein
MSDALHGYSPAKIVREVVAGYFSARGAILRRPICGSLRRNAREVETWRCFGEFSGAGPRRRGRRHF